MAVSDNKWVGYKLEHGGNGYHRRKEDGERILEIDQSLELFLVNAGFRKEEGHLLTCKGRSNSRQIDYVLVR